MAKTSNTSVLALSRPPLPPKPKACLVRKLPSSKIDENTKQQPQALKVRGKDLGMDPKRLKRVMASRQYSQRYRMKQQTYTLQLESESKALHAELTVNGPRVNFLGRKNNLLRTENDSMKEKLAAISNDLMYKEAQYLQLKRERDYLKQLYAASTQMLMPDPFQAANPFENYQFMNIDQNNSGFTP